MSHATTGGELVRQSGATPISPIDGLLGTVALGAPAVAELVTKEGSIASFVFGGVAAIAGLALFLRLDRAQQASKPDIPLHILDRSGQL